MDAELRVLERRAHTGDTSALASYLVKVSRMGNEALKAALRETVLPSLSVQDILVLRRSAIEALDKRLNLVMLTGDATGYRIAENYLRKKNKGRDVSEKKYKAFPHRLPEFTPRDATSLGSGKLSPAEIYYIRLSKLDIASEGYEEVVAPNLNEFSHSYMHITINVFGIKLEDDEWFKARTSRARTRRQNKMKKDKKVKDKEKERELKTLEALRKKYPEVL